MASGVTNKGKYKMLGIWTRNETEPTNFYLALCKTTAPTADTNTMGDLTEVTAANGYSSGGVSVDRNSTDFDTWTEDDTNDRGLVQMKDFTLVTASGGTVPDIRYIVMTDDNATVASREVYLWWDTGVDITVPNGVALIAQNLEIRVNTD